MAQEAVTKKAKAEVSNFTQKLEELQNVMIANNDKDGIYGDGKNLVDNEIFEITHDFSGPLYMRKMKMPANSVVVSAIHHSDHFWFLMSGRILVTTDGEMWSILLHVIHTRSREQKGLFYVRKNVYL